MPKKDDFDAFITKAFWAVLLGVIGYATNQLTDMSRNLAELNTKITVIITEQGHAKSDIDKLSDRVDALEHGK